MRQVILLCLVLLPLFCLAQIRGNVSNDAGLPLAFVNIYIEDTYIGTTSNADGDYDLQTTMPGPYTLVFKYLGYKTVKVPVQSASYPLLINATLERETISLQEVVVNPSDNPANRIMRNAIARRKAHLSKIDAYKADFYSRGLIRIENAPEKILGQDIGDLGGGLDSTRSGIIYLSETVSKIEFKRPDKLKEHIVASKVSGDDSGFSFNNASDVDFNFYNNTVEIGNQIVSPIADYAFNYYRFRLEGVFYDDLGNLINKITVIPRRENDRIVSGSIYIVEDQWSVYALELSLTGLQAQLPGAGEIAIKQTFSYSQQESFWVLISQSIDFEYGIFGIKGDGRFTAVFSNYTFEPRFTEKHFTREVLTFEDEANKKDSLYWDRLRPIPLTLEESRDYLVKDSIQIIRKSQPYLDSIDTQRNQFKLPDLLVGYTYKNSFKNWEINVGSPLGHLKFNTVQGYNSNISLNYMRNIDEYRRYFNAIGSVNYGVSDKRLRATLDMTYKFNNISRPYLSLSAGTTVAQFNGSEPISPLINSVSTLFFEDNYMKLYDRAFVEGSYSEEWFNGMRVFATLGFENRTPMFNTTDQTFFNSNDRSYTSNNPLDPGGIGSAPFEEHQIVKLNLGLRFRFGQDYLSYPHSKYNIPNDKFPSLYLYYETGFGSDVTAYNYSRVMTRLTQGFDIGNKGRFLYNIKAGTFFNSDGMAFMDYKHVNGNQTHIGSTGSYTNVFNNLPYYELSTNNSYVEVHAEHDFKGYILAKVPLLNALNYNMVVGLHAFAADGMRPYSEYSLGIDNIGWGTFRFLRLDYVRSYQGGFRDDALIFGIKILDFID